MIKVDNVSHEEVLISDNSIFRLIDMEYIISLLVILIAVESAYTGRFDIYREHCMS